MRRKENEEPDLNELKEVLTVVSDTIKDNLQNLRDCQKTLKRVQKLLEPEKERWWKKLRKNKAK